MTPSMGAYVRIHIGARVRAHGWPWANSRAEPDDTTRLCAAPRPKTGVYPPVPFPARHALHLRVFLLCYVCVLAEALVASKLILSSHV